MDLSYLYAWEIPGQAYASVLSVEKLIKPGGIGIKGLRLPTPTLTWVYTRTEGSWKKVAWISPLRYDVDYLNEKGFWKKIT